ncbi:MAG: hypothetical protein K0R38_5412 [Polyangiaceae bacterium]|jgi:hypothetical protein|nr:hypothetical protein [Polyangiaceae bacterium]
MNPPHRFGLSPRPRPRDVPEEAVWDFAEEAWVHNAHNARGELHGALRVFGPKGEPRLQLEYRDGKRHGAFQRFHASAKLAQVGRYFRDQLDGLSISFSAGDDSDSIRTCCIPPATRTLKQEYRNGEVLKEAFFAADGSPLAEEHQTDATDCRERDGDIFRGEYDFWPSREALPSVSSADTATVEQPLAELCAAIRRAAQRVEACRALLVEPAPHRAPPDVSWLLSERPALRSFSLCAPEGDAPVQVEEVLSLDSLSTEEVAWRARLAWSALCWLCWAAGARSLGIPERIEAPSQLYAALVHTSERIAALCASMPAPPSTRHFHGLDETLLPASALARLAEHYREIRAVLLFASDPECVSPWQDDLGRDSD